MRRNEQLLSFKQVNSNENCWKTRKVNWENCSSHILLFQTILFPSYVDMWCMMAWVCLRLLWCGYLPSNMNQYESRIDELLIHFFILFFSISLFIDLISSYFMSCRCNVEMIFILFLSIQFFLIFSHLKSCFISQFYQSENGKKNKNKHEHTHHGHIFYDYFYWKSFYGLMFIRLS